MSDGIDLTLFGVMTVIFVIITLLLGWYGYKNTSDNQDFLLGRNKASPLIIALSYGATFLSASAVIGFGVQSAVHGMSLMWLCFLNLFAGLIVAFLIFGKRTRRIGRKLGAATFADLMGKIFHSNEASTLWPLSPVLPIITTTFLSDSPSSSESMSYMEV